MEHQPGMMIVRQIEIDPDSRPDDIRLGKRLALESFRSRMHPQQHCQFASVMEDNAGSRRNQIGAAIEFDKAVH